MNVDRAASCPRIIVFFKHPVAGRVKTRLGAEIGMEAAATVYSAMLMDLDGKLRRARMAYTPYCGGKPVDSMVPWDHFRMQKGADLGERMANAFEDVFAEGSRRAVLVGSDIPGLTPHSLRKSVRSLACADMCIGPSDDGGYYLIGFNKESYDRRMFEMIEWSTPTVLSTTLNQAETYNLRVAAHPTLNDIDTAADLGDFFRNSTYLHRRLNPRLFYERKSCKSWI